jgi:chaperonin GroEL
MIWWAMMNPKTVLFEEESQTKIRLGAEKVYQVAKAAYGPKAGNVLLEKSWGDPILSRDGVTNVREVFLEDPAENMAARIIVQASQKNNQTVGDGTSAVVILAYHLLKEAQRKIGAGINRMTVSRELEQEAETICAYIDSIKKNVTEDMVQKVAAISAGDEALGSLIADTINEVGLDGGVTVEEYQGLGVQNEIVDGFYFQKGFTDINLINNYSLLKSEFTEVPILISEKRLSTVSDIAPLLDKIVGANIRNLVIIGDVVDDALGVLLLNKIKGNITATVVDAPVYGGNRTLFLEDVAVMTGGKVLLSGTDTQSFDKEYLGYAEKVIINEFSTTIIGADGEKDNVVKRIDDLKQQLDEAVHPVTIEAIKNRLSKLTGKIAILRVGGATEVEMKESKLRVEDAVCAVQAAIRDGVVPGGGVALAKAPTTWKSFQQPFMELLENAGENPHEYLAKAMVAKQWHGYDIKNLKPSTTDMLEAGIIDPAQVIKEVVVNAISVVSRLITTTAMITIKKAEK